MFTIRNLSEQIFISTLPEAFLKTEIRSPQPIAVLGSQQAFLEGSCKSEQETGLAVLGKPALTEDFVGNSGIA